MLVDMFILIINKTENKLSFISMWFKEEDEGFFIFGLNPQVIKNFFHNLSRKSNLKIYAGEDKLYSSHHMLYFTSSEILKLLIWRMQVIVSSGKFTRWRKKIINYFFGFLQAVFYEFWKFTVKSFSVWNVISQ